MSKADHILAIDQGTTSTRAILFDPAGRAVASAQIELAQHHPQPGWVEHEPEVIWRNCVTVMQGAMARSGLDVARVAAIGITNQRETAIVWDRATGVPVYRAIVWQDRRTDQLCSELRADGTEAVVQATTGLLLDPYFSATKIAWILDHVPGARTRAERGELAFGTVDSFLLWRLTGGAVHATDATNASRTMLYDIHAGGWDEQMCGLFRVPRAILPEVHDNAGLLGSATTDLLGRSVPITGMAGDQQAALIGQGATQPGMGKATFGTGAFLLVNTGTDALASRHRLLTTPAYRLEGRMTYALEGSIFAAGAATKWLRDGLRMITHAAETEAVAAALPDNDGVYMVPAFVGLGAPHWDSAVRGALHGLTFATGPAHLVRAALESVAYQTHDLLGAMAADGCPPPATLRIDGGMSANRWLCQFLADIGRCTIERPRELETTAVGAAFLAGVGAGLWSDLDSAAAQWELGERFTPSMPAAVRGRNLAGWHDALARTLAPSAASTAAISR